MMQQWSDASMRILAFAWTDHRVEADQVLQNPLVLLGLVAIRDEVRQEAKIAVHQVQEAGVQVVMVTGIARRRLWLSLKRWVLLIKIVWC